MYIISPDKSIINMNNIINIEPMCSDDKNLIDIIACGVDGVDYILASYSTIGEANNEMGRIAYALSINKAVHTIEHIYQ